MINSDTLFEIKEQKYLFRALCITWICFTIYKWNENPVFFGITGAICLFALFAVVEKSIKAKVSSLEITIERWLPLFNKTEVIYYDQIMAIKLDEGKGDIAEFNLFRVIVELFILRTRVWGTYRDQDRIVIIEVNNQVRYYNISGNTIKKKELIELVRKRIKTM